MFQTLTCWTKRQQWMQRKFKSFNIPFVPKKNILQSVHKSKWLQPVQNRSWRSEKFPSNCPSLENFCLLHPDNSSKNVSIYYWLFSIHCAACRKKFKRKPPAAFEHFLQTRTYDRIAIGGHIPWWGCMSSNLSSLEACPELISHKVQVR